MSKISTTQKDNKLVRNLKIKMCIHNIVAYLMYSIINCIKKLHPGDIITIEIGTFPENNFTGIFICEFPQFNILDIDDEFNPSEVNIIWEEVQSEIGTILIKEGFESLNIDKISIYAKIL